MNPVICIEYANRLQIREIPGDMRSHLPPKYYSALETRSPLKSGRLQKCIQELIVSFKTNFDVIFPPLNTPLVMFKYVKKLCLPRRFICNNFHQFAKLLVVEICACSFRLAKVLKIDFRYSNTLSRHKLLEYPELQAIALIVISAKLLQPFDDIIRTPESIKDPSALKVDWNEWRGLVTGDISEGLKLGEEVKVTEHEVFNMSGNKLDEYLDWYQRIWTDEREAKCKVLFL